MDISINIVSTVNTKLPTQIPYNVLYVDLLNNYNRDARLGKTCFEMFKSDDYVKPHFDYEVVLDQYQHSAINDHLINLYNGLNQLFNTTNNDYAASQDCRFVMVKCKETKQMLRKFKISFHLVMCTKKCLINDLGKYLKSKKDYLLNHHLEGLDLQIYRSGISKFRIPMTKKKITDTESLLVPINNFDLDNFHNHLVQIVANLDELEIQIPVINISREQLQIHEEIKKITTETNAAIEQIISSYTVISQNRKQTDEMKITYFDVQEIKCGQNHSSNHNYLIWNHHSQTLKLKCHSDKCRLFEIVLKKPQFKDQEFDLQIINNIPLTEQQQNNYYDVKNYFEQFFVFIRDFNSFYRISHVQNHKYDYTEKLLKPINIQGYISDLFYKEWEQTDESKNDDQAQIVNKSFWKKYSSDNTKTSYLGLIFDPIGVHSANYKKTNDYNLFDGFNYQTIVLNTIIEDVDNRRFKFLIDHIKNYICGIARFQSENNDLNIAKHSFNYLMKILANIIQQPTQLPEIITVFYSKTHGTGKSGFLKFIANVIGQYLTYFGSYDQIAEKHTNAHVGKLINIIEESNLMQSKKHHCTMKTLSQQENAIYNEKNQKQISIKTQVRYFITTNFDDGVYFDDEDRRHVVYTFDKIPDAEYVETLTDILNDKTIIHMFGKYLEHVDIDYSKNDWQLLRPLTSDYKAMIAENPINQFFKDFLQLESVCADYLDTTEYFQTCQVEKNRLSSEISISKEALYKLYKTFYDDNNCMYRKYKNKANFVKYIKTNFDKEIFIERFSSQSRNVYYTIKANLLWKILLPNDPFVNCHFSTSQSRDCGKITSYTKIEDDYEIPILETIVTDDNRILELMKVI